jgi:hypothetical protein
LKRSDWVLRLGRLSLLLKRFGPAIMDSLDSVGFVTVEKFLDVQHHLPALPGVGYKTLKAPFASGVLQLQPLGHGTKRYCLHHRLDHPLIALLCLHGFMLQLQIDHGNTSGRVPKGLGLDDTR